MSVLRVRLAICSMAALSATAHAQVLPGPATPGRVEERFQPPPVPQSAPTITIPSPEVVLPPDKAAATRFLLRGISVEGGTVFTTSDFASLYQPLVGKEVSLLDIYEVRDAITAKYRAAGYVLSQAIIPPQQIPDGSVRIQVVEGYVSAVTLDGDVHDPRGLIKAMATKITRSRPLRVADLERYVLLIGDLPGVEVSTVLKPSPEQAGASTLVVLVKRKPFAASLEADNRGSLAIGPEQFFGEIDANSILGLDEQTVFQAATTPRTSELHYFAVRHDELLSSEGLRLGFAASFSRSRPHGTIAPLHPLGDSQTYTVRLSEPVIRSRSQTLTLGIGFTALNSKIDLLHVPFSDDRLRFLFVDATYDFADTWLGGGMPAKTVIRGIVGHGLNVFGATATGSSNLSRAQGRSDFTKADWSITRLQTLAPRVTLALSAGGQVSGDALLSPQQLGIGSTQFGRGYEPSELTGDQGVGGSVEIRYSLPVGRSFSPQLYAFYDAGVVWLNKPLPGEHSGDSLSSAGVGVRFSLLQHFTADITMAKPLTRDVASRGNRNWRPLFSVSTAF
jgi:hemolysin activation/secretion protein